MARPVFHPNAYLSETRNVRKGLIARTRLLRALERSNATARELAKECALSYHVVLHHLRLLEAEKIVARKAGKKPYLRTPTGVGQQRLKPA